MVVVVCQSFLRIVIATIPMAAVSAVSRRPVPAEEKIATCEASMRREETTIVRYLDIIVVDTVKVEVRVEVAVQVLQGPENELSLRHSRESEIPLQDGICKKVEYVMERSDVSDENNLLPGNGNWFINGKLSR